MMLRLVLWRDAALALAEEPGGAFRRVTGEPFGEDGVAPLVVASLGREAYGGTTACSVAYDAPRASLQSATGSTAEANAVNLANVLGSLVVALRRRFHEEVIDWTLLVDDAYLNRLRAPLTAACWLCGIADAQIVGLHMIATPLNLIPSPTGTGSAVFARLVDGQPGGALAVVAADRWVVVDERHGAAADVDPLALPCLRFEPGAASAAACTSDAHRSQLLLEPLVRSALGSTCAAVAGLAVDDGEWSIRVVAGETILAAEDRYWTSLVPADWQSGGSLVPAGPARVVYLESGQRWFAARTDGYAARLARRKQSTNGVARIAAEAWLSGPLQPAALGGDYAVGLSVGELPASDYRSVARRDQPVPFASGEVTLVADRPRVDVGISIARLDGLSGRYLPVVTHRLRLGADRKRDTAIRVRTAFRRSGLIELSVDVPELRYSESAVYGSGGELLPVDPTAAEMGVGLQ